MSRNRGILKPVFIPKEFSDSDGRLRLGGDTTTPTAWLHIVGGDTDDPPIKLDAGTLLTNAEQGALEFDGNALYFTPTGDKRTVNLANGIITSSTTVANTTTETTIYTEPISASELHEGQIIRCFLKGFYSTVNATDTFVIRMKLGGTTISSKTSVAENVADGPWFAEFSFTLRGVGATGSLISYINSVFNNTHDDQTDTGTTTVDTTAVSDITVTIQWDSADEGNTVTITQGYCEFIN